MDHSGEGLCIPTEAPADRTRLAWWCGLLVAVVACWQVRSVAEFAFVEFDDTINIVFNPHLGPLSRETVAWMFGDMEYMRRYIPLGWLGFALVYGFSGLSPGGYHAANGALHVANSVLVFALLWVLVRRFATEAGGPQRAGAALLGALWWSLHPMRAETVGWASGLLYGIAGCAALGSVLAYLGAWEQGRRRGRWVAGAAILYAASMLAYPMSLGVLGVFVLIDLAHRPPNEPGVWRRLVFEKAVLAVPFLAILGVTAVASYTAPAYWPRPVSLAEFGLGDRLQQAGLVWVYYLWKPWWPASLTPVPTWLVDFQGGGALALGAGVLVVAASGWLLVRLWPASANATCGRRWRGVAVLWFAHAALLAPLLGFTEYPHFASDRYHYLAGVVMAGAVALALARARRQMLGGVWVVALAGAIALGAAQRRQLAVWKDTDSLLQRIIAGAEHGGVRRTFQERLIRDHAHRGNIGRAQGLAAEAGLPWQEIVEPAREGVPVLAALHLRLALDFRRAARTVEAHEHFRLALEIAPAWCEAAFDWAMLHASEGAALEALRWYRRASAPGVGPSVPVAARQRLLLLIARGFAATDRTRLAARTIELALRESANAGLATGLEPQLRAQLERYP
jgi:hypothetical protein